ncbi:MAG TPA: glycosyltransferase family 2 protein [Terracidiphilus sp.]|nr:glycosyltransferase family 2 protein [Terracidiphilus sp.]
MANSDRIGVVTVTYNSAEVLPDFLRCMTEQIHGNFLLFAVDNASEDDTLQLLRSWKDERLRIIANLDNRGVAGGNNQGIKAALEAGCVSILLINNDTSFEPTLIADLDAGLTHHSVEMTCPKIMYYDAPNRIWAAGGGFQLWRGNRSFHYGEGEIDHGQFDSPRLVSYVPTCCVLITSDVFKLVGFMDERYFVYWDDTDFMYRAKKLGIKLLYLPTVTLWHKVGSLTGGGDNDSPFAVRFGTRNSLLFMLKHFGFLTAAPWLALCQVIWILKLLLRIKPKSWFLLKQRAFAESISLWRQEDQSASPLNQ